MLSEKISLFLGNISRKSKSSHRQNVQKKTFCKNNLLFCRNNLFLHLGEVQKLRQEVDVLLNIKTAGVFSLVSARTKMFF